MNSLLWMLTGGNNTNGTTNIELGGEVRTFFTTNVWPYVQWILYILAAVLAVVLVIKGVTTAMAVMKAADEPQVRQEKIGAFKYLAIGLGIAIIILALAPSIVNLILKNGEVDNISSTAFLF